MQIHDAFPIVLRKGLNFCSTIPNCAPSIVAPTLYENPSTTKGAKKKAANNSTAYFLIQIY
jgi:hypothetical protein